MHKNAPSLLVNILLNGAPGTALGQIWLFWRGTSNASVRTHNHKEARGKRPKSWICVQGFVGNRMRPWFLPLWRVGTLASLENHQENKGRSFLQAKDTAWADLLFWLLCQNTLAASSRKPGLEQPKCKEIYYLTVQAVHREARLQAGYSRALTPLHCRPAFLCGFCFISGSRHHRQACP